MRKTINEVVHFANGMVMVFDENGGQISEYQGKYEDVRSEILRDCHIGTMFAKAKNLKKDYVAIDKADF